MEDMVAYLKRGADRCGFVREVFQDRRVPTNRQNIQVFHFFGDARSEFILASLLLRRYKEEMRGSKYLVMCSWPGHQCLYPYADEYWGCLPVSEERLLAGATGFQNQSEVFGTQQKNLNWFFENVDTYEELQPYYEGGFTKRFHERMQVVKRSLPMVPSAGVLEPRLTQEMAVRPGWKVAVVPTKKVRHLRNGRMTNLGAPREFWKGLVDRMVGEGITPLVLGLPGSYDLSPDCPDCIHARPSDLSQTLGLMRASACVVDVFNGISRYAIAARAPFLAVEERSRFAAQREYEVDDLCANELPKQYIFGFPTIIEGGDPAAWKYSFYDSVAARLRVFLPAIDREKLPATAESVVAVPFSVVKEHKAKRIGAKFVKVRRD